MRCAREARATAGQKSPSYLFAKFLRVAARPRNTSSVRTRLGWLGTVTKPRNFKASHRETAQLIGISAEALRRAVNDRGCPVLKRGVDGEPSVYSLRAVIAWRCQDILPDDLSTERARLAREQADKLAMANSERRGITATTADVEARWLLIVAKVRARVLCIPPRLVRKLRGVNDINAIEELINAELHKTLDELADGG